MKSLPQHQPKQKLVVIGNGMAGARTVEEIMARGGQDLFEITIFSAEHYGNYNRILLSNVLNGSSDMREILLHPLDWYKMNGLQLHLGAPVTSIDREAKTVTNAHGVCESYDVLIFATGSRPFVPPMDGLRLEDGRTKPGVFTLRTLDDCQKIAGYAAKCERAAVLGGGLLGLEAARGIAQFGARVDIVHLSKWLMNVQLDADAGGMLASEIEEMGMGVHLEKATTQVLGEESVTGIRFADGSELPCDMLVVACGVRPNAEVARDNGFTVNRAIVVNDQLRVEGETSIYAVGECAEHRGVVYGLVEPIWEQVAVLADVVTGKRISAAYKGSKISTRLKVLGVELVAMGINEPRDDRDEVVVYAEPKRGRYKKLIIRDDRLVGAILLGDTERAATLLQAFDHGSPLPRERQELLFNLGTAPAAIHLSDMPPSTKVCNCNDVTKATICKAVENGADNALAVMACTRAGTGCGSCKRLVGEIVDWMQESMPAQRH